MPETTPIPIPRPPGAGGLRRSLRAWYRRHRRDLPWREADSSYAVLVSEFMLQQTTVATVLPYFARFLERFPTVQTLADADEDAVRAAWSGLGYYRRARNLQAAARALVRDHDGELPADYDALRALPGVGDYTAAALASIVHGISHAVVDGNVIRVLARLTAYGESVSRAPSKRALQDLADRLLDRESSGDWNQAMMELGATVCTPRAPSCTVCPWEKACLAHAIRDPERFPRKDPARVTVPVERAVGVLRRGDRVLLIRRSDPQLLDGTWEFPGLDVTEALSAQTALHRYLTTDLSWQTWVGAELARVKHAITHRRITVRAFAVHAEPAPRARKNERAWVSAAELAGYPTSSMTSKLFKAMEKLLETPEA